MIKASEHGYIEVAKELLDAGAVIESKDWYGKTPLIYGIFCNNLFNLNFILFCFEASANGHIEVAKLLVERGADIESKDSFEKTPLISGKCFIKFSTDIINYFYV